MGERKQGVLRAMALGLALGAILVLAALPSAAANSTQPNQAAAQVADLTTVPAIKKYLRSVGVSTNGLVIQRGARNYAGPNCPGPAWNCTTSTKVVQLAARAADDDDNRNRYVCKRNRGSGSQTQDKTPPEQSCVIVQPAGTNSATCEIETSAKAGLISQTCLITQGGSSNTAVARLEAVLTGPATEQDVLQRIEIKQTGGSSSNNLAATQTARLLVGASGGDDDDDDDDDNGSSGQNANGANVSLKQDFHQVICTNQLASGSGRNNAAVLQRGVARANYRNAGDVNVLQNTESLASTCLATGPAAPYLDISGEGHNPTLCPVETGDFGTAKANANTCARVQQDSTSGQNLIGQGQWSVVNAGVDGADVVDIAQGSLLGGIESTQDQRSTGVSRILDVQDADQLAFVEDQNVANITQLEDPRCCAAGHQLGNDDSTWALRQDLTQRAFVDGVLVDPETFEGGTTEQRGANYGNCSTAGNCTVEQRLSNNVETETNSCSGSECDVFTDCTASGETGVCTTNDDISISNTATATSTTPDPNTENNSATETTLVLADAPVPLVRAFKAVQAAAQAITPTTDAGDLAAAIEAQDGLVSGAVFADVSQTETIVPHAVSDTELTGFPTAGETYAILTTGDASLAATEGGFADGQIGGANVRGDTDFDVTVLQINLAVPEGPNCLTFDFRFLSEEFPDFVGGQYNDAFIAELDNSTWDTLGSTITADDNFAFDPSGGVISINSTGVADMTAGAAAGTVYGGATPLLRASTPITEGAHSLFLSIFDQGDIRFDSAVFVDNLVLGTQTEGGCEEGVDPVGEADLSVTMTDAPDPVAVGGSLVYTIDVSNAGPDTAEDVTLTDDLPELLDFSSAVTEQGTCTETAPVSCDLGAIEPDSSVTVVITALP